MERAQFGKESNEYKGNKQTSALLVMLSKIVKLSKIVVAGQGQKKIN